MKLAGRGRRFSQLTDLPDRGRRGLAALARDAEAYGISAAKRQVQEKRGDLWTATVRGDLFIECVR
jgi:hypothetical protein